jgi:hypothetical protein
MPSFPPRYFLLTKRHLAMMAELDPVSASILSFISILDRYGAQEWNSDIVALLSFLFLLGVRISFGSKKGVDWYALIHALVSGYGAVMCVWLDFFASKKLTGVAEPLRSLQCEEPLTSLHRLLPALTLGYSVMDLSDGLALSKDFLLHGLATMLISTFFHIAGKPQILTGYLIMEVSTFHLNLTRAEFLSTPAQLVNQLCFALTFFAVRIVLVPYNIFVLNSTLYKMSSTRLYQECFPWYFFPAIFVFCVTFCCLNAYCKFLITT